MYRLIYEKKSDSKKISLMKNQSVIRQWHGQFAEMIYISESASENKHRWSMLELNKKQVHGLFINITYLHQKLLIKYEVETDIINQWFSCSIQEIAKSILLQIRMNPCHLSYDELLKYYIDEFHTYDMNLFNLTTQGLSESKLIQIIHTEEGKIFFDRNTRPHNHIYFKNQNKLIDCSSELANFLMTEKPEVHKQRKKGRVFTLETSPKNSHIIYTG